MKLKDSKNTCIDSSKLRVLMDGGELMLNIIIEGVVNPINLIYDEESKRISDYTDLRDILQE
jgi:hypothetical protein